MILIILCAEDSLAQNKSGSRIDQARVKRTQVSNKSSSISIVQYKRLPFEKKLRLYNVTLKTMAMLERSYYRQSRSSAFYFLKDLWLTKAYAQSTPPNCFYGGHIVESCDWQEAEQTHSTCQIGGEQDGVVCNTTLFSSGICVHKMAEAQRRGLRNYSTTQACAYADAHIKAQNLLRSQRANSDQVIPLMTNDQIVKSQLTDKFWDSSNPDAWHDKKEEIVKMVLGEEGGLEQYNNYLKKDVKNIVAQLGAVQEACNHVVNAFEKKHCAYFEKELEEANLLYSSQSNDNNSPPEPRPSSDSNESETILPNDQTCDKLNHCTEVKEGNVCIIESGMHKLIRRSIEYSNSYVATYVCPEDSLTYFIEDKTNINGILNALNNVAGEHCTKIKRLYLSGYGTPGSLANGLNKDNVSQLKDYSCLMADNSTVDLSGCSAGKGCAGKLFMQKTAEALFQNTQGTVISPNVDVWFGIDVGNYSDISFAYNSLTFELQPPEPPQTNWEKLENRVAARSSRNESDSYQDTIMAGILGEPIEDKSLPDECIDEIHEKQMAVIEEMKSAIKRGCTPLTKCTRRVGGKILHPFSRLLDQGELWMRAGSASGRRGYNRSSTFSQAAKVVDQLDTVHKQLKECGMYCMGFVISRVGNNSNSCPDRVSCMEFSQTYRGNKQCREIYREGCSITDYFLPRIQSTATHRRANRGTR